MSEFNVFNAYTQLVQSVEQTEGLDVANQMQRLMYKELGTSASVEEQYLYLNELATSRQNILNNVFNTIEYNSGKSAGLYTVTETSSVTSGIESTASNLVTFNGVYGTDYVDNTILLRSAGSTTGKTGSVIAGKLATAVSAVGCAALLGVVVDSIIYNSNPNYWDEKLPTLNPETWDDIILKRDTNLPFLHNVRTGKSYINENMLAYTALLGGKENWFADSYNEKTDTHTRFNGYSCSVTTAVKCNVYQRGNPYGEEQVITISNGYFVSFNDGSNSSDMVFIIHQPDKTPKVNFRFNGVSLHSYFTGLNWGNFTYDDKTAYATDMSLFTGYTGDEMPENTYFVRTSTPNTKVLPPCIYPKPEQDGWTGILAWLGLYGNTTKQHSDAPEGFNKIGVVPNMSGITTLNGAKSKLRTTYPDLYDNALDIPFVNQDGIITNSTWLPFQIPNDGTKDKPSSTNLTQTSDGSYPNEETKNKSNEDVATPSLTQPTPVNPVNPLNPTEKTPEIVTPVSPADTGLGAVYVPTIEQLRSFSAWLWSPNFIDQIKKLFSDPMQGIIGLHQVYYIPTHSGTDTIHCGYLDSEVTSDYTTVRYNTVDCGSINLREIYGNIFDYDPYTNIEIYLPFIGIVPLKVGDVMRGSLSVTYTTDVLTGACLCNINVTRDGNSNTLYTYGGNCAVNYPLSSGSYMGIVSALAGVGLSVATAIGTGGASIPLSVAGGVSSMLNAHTNVKTSGGYGGNTGAMGIKKPYIIIKNTLPSMPNDYEKYTGNPYNNVNKISNCKGFTQANILHLVGDMTQEEKTEISALFSSGVII